MGKPTIKVAIFNSYVKLPEGMLPAGHLLQVVLVLIPVLCVAGYSEYAAACFSKRSVSRGVPWSHAMRPGMQIKIIHVPPSLA